MVPILAATLHMAVHLQLQEHTVLGGFLSSLALNRGRTMTRVTRHHPLMMTTMSTTMKTSKTETSEFLKG